METISSIVTAVATVAGVVLANTLTLRRSNREKTWDLRRQAYGTILAALASAEGVCDSAEEYINEDADRYFNEDQPYRRHNEQIAGQMALVRQRFSDDYLALSNEFVTLFEEFLRELSSGDHIPIPPEEHEYFVGVLRKHRPRLLEKARSEIAVDARWAWPRRISLSRRSVGELIVAQAK